MYNFQGLIFQLNIKFIDMSDDFAPLHNAYRLNDSVISSTGSLSSSVMSMSSRSSHCQSSYYQPKRKSESGNKFFRVQNHY